MEPSTLLLATTGLLAVIAGPRRFRQTASLNCGSCQATPTLDKIGNSRLRLSRSFSSRRAEQKKVNLPLLQVQNCS